MHDSNRPLNAAELRTRARLEGLILSKLPGTEIVRDGFGHTVLKFRGKSLALMGSGHEERTGVSLALKADRFAQDHLIKKGGFIKTPYIGQHGWVSLTEEQEIEKRWDAVVQLLVEAHTQLQPKQKSKAKVLPEKSAPKSKTREEPRVKRSRSAPKKKSSAKKKKAPAGKKRKS